MIVFLDNVCVYLTDKLTKDSTTLPISASDKAQLCEELGEDGHSYLTLSTSLGTEIIKVSCVEDCVAVERDVDGMGAVTGAKGKCLCFKVNKPVIDDYLMEGGPEACQVTIEVDEDDWIEITPPEDGECNWKISIKEEIKERFEECCPEESDCECENCELPDGTYENATLTIKGGKVCGVTKGKNIVYTGGSCCSCGQCDSNS